MAVSATYVGGSQYYDIAVLRVEDSELLKRSDVCAVAVSDSCDIVIGESAIAVGNAQGLGISVTSGIVSVDSEYITMTAADGKTSVSFRVMRVDTAINSGNSGGGLFNDEGKLIGIVNAKIVYDGVENIGYAIPSDIAISVANNIIDNCYGTDAESVRKAVLGVTVTATESKAFFDAETGLISLAEVVSVYDISDGSPASEVLKKGDIIVSASIDGETKKITRQFHIIDMMLDVRENDTLILVIIRDGAEMTVSITFDADSFTAY